MFTGEGFFLALVRGDVIREVVRGGVVTKGGVAAAPASLACARRRRRWSRRRAHWRGLDPETDGERDFILIFFNGFKRSTSIFRVSELNSKILVGLKVEKWAQWETFPGVRTCRVGSLGKKVSSFGNSLSFLALLCGFFHSTHAGEGKSSTPLDLVNTTKSSSGVLIENSPLGILIIVRFIYNNDPCSTDCNTCTHVQLFLLIPWNRKPMIKPSYVLYMIQIILITTFFLVQSSTISLSLSFSAHIWKYHYIFLIS